VTRNNIRGVVIVAAVLSAASLYGQTASILSLRLSPQITVGEPVELTFEFINSSTERTLLELGWNEAGAFSFELVEPSGKVQRARPQSPPEGGIAATGRIRVGPSERHSGHILLSEWLRFKDPGRYQLLVRFDGRPRPISFRKAIHSARHFSRSTCSPATKTLFDNGLRT